MATRKRSRNTNDSTALTEENTTVTTTAPAGFDPSAMASAVSETEMPARSRQDSRDKYANNPFVDQIGKSRETGKALGFDTTASAIREASQWIRDAARKAESGVSIVYRYDVLDDQDNRETVTSASLTDMPAHDDYDYPVHLAFRAKAPRQVAQRGKSACPTCGKEVTVNSTTGGLRTHKGTDGNDCAGSGHVPAAPADDQDTDQS